MARVCEFNGISLLLAKSERVKNHSFRAKIESPFAKSDSMWPLKGVIYHSFRFRVNQQHRVC